MTALVAAATAQCGRVGRYCLDRMTNAVGGRERRRVVVVLGAVMSLAAADLGMIGALVPQMEDGLHIGNTEIGLLVTVSGLAAAMATLPFGVLVDRLPRLRLLAYAVALWGVAEVGSGLAPSFGWLLGIRVLLGGLTAVAGPAVASLTGDYFPASERGRMYGYILAGEVIGAGAGFVIADIVVMWAGWRAALAVLGLPSIALYYVLTRRMHEPARGGTSRLRPTAGPAAERAEEPDDDGEAAAAEEVAPPRSSRHRSRVHAAARESGARIDERAIPSRPPRKLTAVEAARYALRVRTNLLLIVASSLGYFYLNGLRTFAVLFVRGQYGVGQGMATLVVLLVGAGVLAGVLLGGRLADRFLERRLTARLSAGALGYLVGAGALVLGIWSGSLGLAVPLFVVAGAAIAEPNPPLDAARLDIVASGVWGRAESVRTVVRGVFESFAPLFFGIVSSAVAGTSRPGWSAGVNAGKAAVSQQQAAALRDTFLILVVALAGAGLIILRARRHYPSDVLSAAEYETRSAASTAAESAPSADDAGTVQVEKTLPISPRS